MAEKPTAKKVASLDELLRADSVVSIPAQSCDQKTNTIRDLILGGTSTKTEEIKNIDLDLIDYLDSFEHPFEKSVNKGIDELAEKVKLSGVLEPILLRSKMGGRYELLAGHRRTKASRMAGKTTIPAIIKECDDNTAKIIVTDTNLGQRDEILPSEKAKAYKLQIEALKSQGKRTDLIEVVDKENDLNAYGSQVNSMDFVSEIDKNNLWPNRPQVKSRDIVAQMNNTSAKQISRHLRLNEVINSLLDLTDNKEIPFWAAVELSYLKPKEQEALFEVLVENPGIKITIANATELRKESKEIELNKLLVEAILNPEPEQEKKQDFITKATKPIYKTAFKNIEKYIKKDSNRSEKLALADQDELERTITEAIDSYLDSL